MSLINRWWIRGERAPGVCDRRFEWAYIFGAVRPANRDGFALVLPTVSTEAMQRFLDDFAATRPADAHAVMVLDQAGWHGAKPLAVPANLTPGAAAALQPRAQPGRTDLAVPSRKRSVASDPRRLRRRRRRLLRDQNALVADPSRIASLTRYPWIDQVCS